jgi:hypothetical protein
MNLQLLGRPDDQPHGYFCAPHPAATRCTGYE